MSNRIVEVEMTESALDPHDRIRAYYDDIFYGLARRPPTVTCHLRRLARRLGPWQGKQLLDVACGTGAWLRAAADRGAVAHGIDVSSVAIELCRRVVPEAHLGCGVAEALPFEEARFDFVSCLGSLEHFLDPVLALREMVRVAKPAASFLFLVPNRDFLTRRLGLYRGTEQMRVREELRTLAGWAELFGSAGLSVTKRWRDLHLLSADWILRGEWYGWPVRAAQAAALPLWPLSWQYQVYHLCEIR